MCVRACVCDQIDTMRPLSLYGGASKPPYSLPPSPRPPCDTLIARRKRYIPKRGGDSKRLMVDSVSGQAQKNPSQNHQRIS